MTEGAHTVLAAVLKIAWDIYILYIYPELKLACFHFRLGKGAGPPYSVMWARLGEQRGSRPWGGHGERTRSKKRASIIISGTMWKTPFFETQPRLQLPRLTINLIDQNIASKYGSQLSMSRKLFWVGRSWSRVERTFFAPFSPKTRSRRLFYEY